MRTESDRPPPAPCPPCEWRTDARRIEGGGDCDGCGDRCAPAWGEVDG